MDINSGFIVAVPQENSDITANAFAGNGGNINITSQGIFGLLFSDELTPNSDITASSQLGINGTININTPDVDPSSGRGGLPEDPRQMLRGQIVLQDMRVVADFPNKFSGQISNRKVPDLEATGWMINQQGQVELVVNTNPVKVSYGRNKGDCGNLSDY